MQRGYGAADQQNTLLLVCYHAATPNLVVLRQRVLAVYTGNPNFLEALEPRPLGKGAWVTSKIRPSHIR